TDGHIFGGTAAVTTDQQGQATAAAQAGIVVLDNLTAPVGGIITGRVTDPNNQGFASVVGCGFSFPNNSVSFDANGLFSLTLPASQAAGVCKLTFSVQSNNAPPPPATEDFTITVTAIAPGVTAAPDLVSASRDGSNISSGFDTPIQGASDPTKFHAFNFDGSMLNAQQVSGSGYTAVAL